MIKIGNNMLKDSIINILDHNEERIKSSFKIDDDDEISKIREFLNTDHKNFRAVIDNMSTSNLNDRGKMVACCIIGYVNGTVRSQLFKFKTIKGGEKMKIVKIKKIVKGKKAVRGTCKCH